MTGPSYQIQDDCRDDDIFWMAGINQRVREHLADPSISSGGWDYTWHASYSRIQNQGWQQLSIHYPTLGRMNGSVPEVIECHVGETPGNTTESLTGERSIEGWWLVTEGEDPTSKSYQPPGTRNMGDAFTSIVWWAEFPCLGDVLDVTRDQTRPGMTQLTIHDELGSGIYYDPPTALPIGRGGGYPWPPRWIDDLYVVRLRFGGGAP